MVIFLVQLNRGGGWSESSFALWVGIALWPWRTKGQSRKIGTSCVIGVLACKKCDKK